MKSSIKDLVFDVLPADEFEWLIIGWGKIINERKGSYKQQIVLRRLSRRDDPKFLLGMQDENNLICYANVDIGSIRIFSPGTIVKNQRINTFVEEYLEKVKIRISEPQSVEKSTIPIVGWQQGLFSDIDRINVKVFKPLDLEYEVVIPCSVIADYYFFGMTPLTKAVLDGTIGLEVGTRNTVFNPHRVFRAVSITNKKVAYVELGRKMFVNDKVKIGRIAHDNFFWTKCMGVFASLVAKDPEGAFIDVDFPIRQPTELMVYGAFVNRRFLVHLISNCNVRPTFDVLIADKPFKGKAQSGINNPGDDQPFGNRLLLLLKPGKGKMSKTHLDPEGVKDVTGGRPKWDAPSEMLTYNRDQSNSFSDEDAIDEKDFANPNKKGDVVNFMHKHGLAFALSTNPDKLGSENTLQLNLFAQGPIVPPNQPPTTAFAIIEKLTAALETHLKMKGYGVDTEICCPCRVADDPYTTFPVDKILAEQEYRTVENLNFCFLKVKKFGHTHYRRIFIKRFAVGYNNLYVMDVEPKYSDKENNRFVMSFGVIFHTGHLSLSDDMLREVLLKIVISNRTPDSQWRFLKTKYNYPYTKIQHRGLEMSYHGILNFLEQIEVYTANL